MKEFDRVWANINLDAICANIKHTRTIIEKYTKVMAIVKADGYGHGAIPVARVLQDLVDAYGVAIIEEAIELRKAGVTKPILILGNTPASCFPELITYHITQTIFSYEMAQVLSEMAISMNQIAEIHIKIDTGMGRLGFLTKEESLNIIQKIAKLKGIRITGSFTHFACADMADKTSAQKQYKTYLSFLYKLEQRGIQIPVNHISNSAGIINLPNTNIGMVRSGISMYGLYPSQEVNKEKLVLFPAMELKTTIVHLKEVEEGTTIGYGSTFITKRKSKIATIPVGYGDGYPRKLSNKGRVLICGKSVPIIGRICMDQFMVDVTEFSNIQVGDRVTLLGKDGTENITIEEWANLTDSFHYELVCNIGKRIPRVYYYNNNKVGTWDYFTNSVNNFEFVRKEEFVKK